MRFGLAKLDITPDRPVYMAGYAARTSPSEGCYLPLEAKCLVIDDGAAALIWITTDLIGFDQELGPRLLQAVAAAAGVPEEHVLLSCSHTHCGPTLRAVDRELFGPGAVDGYDDALLSTLPGLAREAMAGRREGSLRYGVGHSRMAISRRRVVDGRTQMLPNPDGVIDDEMGLLTVHEADGRLAAVLAAYACHPTTMGGQLLGPDYPGYFRLGLSEALPGVEALFVQGCGGDVKPNSVVDGRFAGGPLSEVERCGRWLATDALKAIDGTVGPLVGPLRSRREVVALPLAEPYPREVYEQAVAGSNRWFAKWGAEVLARLDAGEALPDSLPFWIQVVTLGDQFILAALGGEVCVEIGLRLKRELRERYEQVMVIAYCNGMRGYQAARRQFPEGGYEVEEWFRYSGLPAPYAPEIEDVICAAVHRLVGTPG